MRSDEPSKISRRSRFQGASAACAPWPVPSSTTSAVFTKGAGGTVAEPLGPGHCDELSGEALDGDVLAALHGDSGAAAACGDLRGHDQIVKQPAAITRLPVEANDLAESLKAEAAAAGVTDGRSGD